MAHQNESQMSLLKASIAFISIQHCYETLAHASKCLISSEPLLP